MLRKFNINSNVKVKLTDKGRQLFHSNKLYEKFPFPRTLIEDDGYSTWQLWDLMSEFGEHIWLGADNCFSTIILIDDKDLGETVQ